MTMFWLLLALAILFIIGSAMALNALGRGKPPTRKPREPKDPH